MEQTMTLESLLKLPVIRDALRNSGLDVNENLLHNRLAVLDELAEFAEPLAKAKEASDAARADFEKARKAMEVARGKLGNAEQRFNEINGRQRLVAKRLHGLGESAVESAGQRLNSLLAHLKLKRESTFKVAESASAKGKRHLLDAVGELDIEIHAAKEALARLDKLRHARISPVEITETVSLIMAPYTEGPASDD